MRKIYLLLILISIFALSCGNHFFNPRYYYNKSSSSSSGSNPEPPAPPEELPEGVDDPFEKGDWNNPGYGGYDIFLIKEKIKFMMLL